MKKLLCIVVIVLFSCVLYADDMQKKAEGGDVIAQVKRGVALLGDDDQSNNTDGIKWLEMAANGGSITAHYNLGCQFQDGVKVKQNIQRALLHLTVAAELGEVRAMNRLAGLYYVGEFVPQNDIIAVKWATIAASSGDETAKRNAARMRSNISERDAVLGAHAAMSWIKYRTPMLSQKTEK